MAQEGSKLFIRQIIRSQVAWKGQNSQKAKENKENGNKSKKIVCDMTNVGGGGPRKDGDAESYVQGTYQVGESSCKIVIERKMRSCSEGDYSKKPARDARPMIHFTLNEKGFVENRAKKTLGHIFRMKFDEDTIWTKGAAREVFYNSCVKNFKEYYVYPFPYDDEDGDQVVRSYLQRNWKSYLGAERSRLVVHVKNILDCGYTEDDFNIRDEALKPYYFSQRTWNSICDYWEAEEFKKASANAQIARSKVEFMSRSGAKPFELRRQEINEEREAKGELPISDEEFMNIVYDPTQPAVKDLQEKMKKARAQLAPEFERMEEPSSPRSQKQFSQMKDVMVLAKARSPRKGMINLHSQDTLAELLGARDAVKLFKKQKVVKSQSEIDAADEIQKMTSEIFDAVWEIVFCLTTHEVKQSVLDEEVRKLAYAAFPDPSQQSLRNQYVRAASGLLRPILKKNDKIVVEDTVQAEQTVGNSFNNGDEERGRIEDVDLDAYNYPLL